MAIPAGQLSNRLAFYKKIATTADVLGNVELTWELQFTVVAKVVHRFGGEAVLQARLSGQNVANITVRQNRQTAQITSDWKAVDVRSEDTWNIRSAYPDDRNRSIEILAERGVPT